MDKEKRATVGAAAPKIKNAIGFYSYLGQTSSQNSELRNNFDDISLHEAILGLAVLLGDSSLIPSEKSLNQVMLRNGICLLVNRSRGAER